MQQTHKHKMKVNMICQLIEGSHVHVTVCVLISMGGLSLGSSALPPTLTQ